MSAWARHVWGWVRYAVVGPLPSRAARYVQERAHLAVKATLAACLAWALARYLLDLPESAAYWAPLSALFVMTPTVASSMREGLQYVSGFLLGVGVGMLVAVTVGPNMYGVLAVVVMALGLGSWGKLGQQGVEVPFIGLFVLLYAGHTPLDYVPSRMLAVGVGAPVGVLINVFVFPPLHLRPATESLYRLRDNIAALLEDMADGLTKDWPPSNPDWLSRSRATNEVLYRARRALRRAFESLQWNPRGRRSYREPRRALVALNGLDYITTSMGNIAGTLTDAVTSEYISVVLEDDFRTPYAELLRQTAHMVRGYVVPEQPQTDPEALDGAFEQLRKLRESVVEREHRHIESWFTEGDLVIEVERILNQLSDTTHSLQQQKR